MNIENLRYSAEGCGYIELDPPHATGNVIVCHRDMKGTPFNFRWNPPENAEQDRECLKELLRRGYRVTYDSDRHHGLGGENDGFAFYEARDCAPEDFAYRALAEVVRREK